jgi:Zn-dependent alcohol dehydrogenase
VPRAVGEPLAISADLRLRDPGPGEVRVALKGLDEVNEAFAAMEGGEVVRSVIRF